MILIVASTRAGCGHARSVEPLRAGIDERRRYRPDIHGFRAISENPFLRAIRRLPP